jgi:hypothetical protein
LIDDINNHQQPPTSKVLDKPCLDFGERGGGGCQRFSAPIAPTLLNGCRGASTPAEAASSSSDRTLLVRMQ